MSLRHSSNLKIDLQRTPPRSGVKQDNTLLSKSKPDLNSESRPELPRPELSSRKQEPAQLLVEIPPKAQSQAFNFITMGRFQIGSSITRVRICKLLLLLTIKILSILTATVFWLSAPIYLKTLLNWQAPGKIFYELTLRYLSGSPPTTPIWRHIFPGTDCSNSHHLRLAVHSSSYLHSPIIYSTSIPLLLDNPIVWLFVMVFMFSSHHLLCFAYDCLSKVSPTIGPAN
jgi:hypothetical protein